MGMPTSRWCGYWAHSSQINTVVSAVTSFCPRGPTDKASAYGAEDSEFESLRGYTLFSSVPMHVCSLLPSSFLIFRPPLAVPWLVLDLLPLPRAWLILRLVLTVYAVASSLPAQFFASSFGFPSRFFCRTEQTTLAGGALSVTLSAALCPRARSAQYG